MNQFSLVIVDDRVGTFKYNSETLR